MDPAALDIRRQQRAAAIRAARREIAAEVLLDLSERIWYWRPVPVEIKVEDEIVVAVQRTAKP